MTTHAMTFVKWGVFRAGAGERYSRGYYYACRRPRLLKAVEEGDTLWLVTSKPVASTPAGQEPPAGEIRRQPQKTLVYALAYKLVDCERADPSQEKLEQFGSIMVRSRDWSRSVHFPSNDVGATLRRLRLTTGRPMWDESNIGNRLTVSIPRLTPEDVMLMEAFQQHVLSERTVFLSYSRRDVAMAVRLERELEDRNVHVFRDAPSLHPGEPWEQALERAVRACESFLVLVSPASACSQGVRREVAWALDERCSGGLVRYLVPILLSGDGWQAFPELHYLHRVDYPAQPDGAFFDRLAKHLVDQPRGRRA